VLALICIGFSPDDALARRSGKKNKAPKTSHPAKGSKSSTWENFTYKIVALNQRAGVVSARVEKDKRGRSTTLYAKSETTGTVAKAFPMDHRQLSHLRKGKGFPTKTVQQRDDPFGKMALKMTFPKRKNKATSVQSHRNGKDRTRQRKLPMGVHDPLSALLSISSRETKVGDSWDLPFFSGVKLYGVQAKTVAKEEIWTPGMGMQSAYKIELKIHREPKWTQSKKKGFKVTAPARDKWNRTIELWISAERPGVVLHAVYRMQPLGEVVVTLESFHVEKVSKKKKARKKS